MLNHSRESGTEQQPLNGQLLPAHLVRVPGEHWSFWRWICLRGSGFPSWLVKQLGASEAARAADELLAAEQQVQERAAQAVSAFRSAIDSATDPEEKKLLSRSLKHLQKGRAPEFVSPSLTSLMQHLGDSQSHLDRLRARYEQIFAEAVIRISENLRKAAADNRFRQAVLLQNREALRRVTHSFSRPKRGFKERQNEEMIANYIQRYCVKNDTIGFFGPVGWARFSSPAQSIAVNPGATLVTASSVQFENWGIEALADKFAENRALRPWMKPRMLPLFHIEGTRLYSSGIALSSLSLLHATLLKLCTGERTARHIARILVAAEPELQTEERIYRLLEIFESRGIIHWKFEIPICLQPERYLRSLLDNIEDEKLKLPLLSSLDRLEQSRDRVATAVGDAAQLDSALDLLDATFTELTGKASTKSAGSMYASRTLIYQDCRRNAEVELGPEIIEALGTPLALLLTSARWFSYRAATLYRQEFERQYEEILRKNGGRTVELVQMWARAEPLIFDASQRIFHRVLPEFQQRWSQILKFQSEESRVSYSSAELRSRIHELFAAPSPGWRLARYHSPDVMIAASGIDAIRRGDCLFVLGEVHITTNTQRFSFATAQHPHAEELFAALESDFPEPHIQPVPPRQWPRITNRTAITLESPQDYYLEVSDNSIANAPRSRVLPIGSLVVKKTNEGFAVQTRDGSLSFDLIEFLGEILSGAAVEMMKLVSPGPHIPRITIDRLVIARESWSFPAQELRCIDHEEEHQRFLAARRWKLEHSLPRFVFVKVPVEVKPLYLDLDSPVYVEIFVKMVRRMLASHRAHEPIVITEMLPGPEELWLTDAEGQTYTCELRIVAKDLIENETMAT